MIIYMIRYNEHKTQLHLFIVHIPTHPYVLHLDNIGLGQHNLSNVCVSFDDRLGQAKSES